MSDIDEKLFILTAAALASGKTPKAAIESAECTLEMLKDFLDIDLDIWAPEPGPDNKTHE